MLIENLQRRFYIRLLFLLSLLLSGKSYSQEYCSAENFVTDYCSANVVELKFGGIWSIVRNIYTGYYDYLHKQAEVKPGQTLLMTVSFDRVVPSGDSYITGEIYIDWNADYDFDDENELVFHIANLNGKGTFSIPIVVPEDAELGLTRLRTRMNDYKLEIGPCGPTTETQDYSVNITSGIQLTAPTEILAKSLTSNSIGVSWRDNSSSETSSIIQRSTDGHSFNVIDTLPPNEITYTDSLLNKGTKYYYRVSAISGPVSSDYSSVASATTLTFDFKKVIDGDVQSTIHTRGVFLGDFNNDNKPDLFTSGTDFLYLNNDSVFIELESDIKHSGAGAWADYDNDGDLDLYITSFNNGGGDKYNMLYKNNGDSTFTELIPMEIDNGVLNAIWTDFNKDGKLDLFISFLALQYSTLYLNNGDDTFTEELVIDNANGFSSFADYDNDGDPDLFVARYYENLLFENNGEGALILSETSSLSSAIELSIGASWGDIDNDGDLDLFIANGSNEEENNSLYLNLGAGEFEKVTSGKIVRDGGQSGGSTFCDFDNDGNLDLFVANYQQDNWLYLGNGDGSFKKIEQSIVANEFSESNHDRISSSGCACGDFNQDGFPDLIVSNVGDDNFHYMNEGNLNNWLRLKLIGIQSNKSAIGAKVKLFYGKGIQFREVTTQTGYAGQNELTVSFGLGSYESIDSVLIIWPSGIHQILHSLNVNELHIIEEAGVIPLGMDFFKNEINTYPNPIHDYLQIEIKSLPLPMLCKLVDVNGRVLRHQLIHKDHSIIDTSQIPAGIYFLLIENEERIIFRKVVKN